jgi:cysteine desulfurase
LLGAQQGEVVFCSGATEAIQLGIRSFVASRSKPARIALPLTEHRAVLDVVLAFRDSSNCIVEFLPVDDAGRIDVEAVESVCQRGCDLLVMMHGNNEIGTIHDLERVVSIATKYGVACFSDTKQTAGKVPIRFDEWGLGFAVVSGHKIYGMKGVGALVHSRKLRLVPTAGEALRPGTPNTVGIASLGLACELRYQEMVDDEARIASLRDRMQRRIQSALNIKINGDERNRLSGNLNFSVAGIDGSAVLARLRHRISISTGSACYGGVEHESHVLKAIGLDPDLAEGTFRIGIGKFNTPEEIDIASNTLISEIRSVMESMRVAVTS